MQEQDKSKETEQQRERSKSSFPPVTSFETFERRIIQGELTKLSEESDSVSNAARMKELAEQLFQLETFPKAYFAFRDAMRLFEYSLSEEGTRVKDGVFGFVCERIATQDPGCKALIEQLPKLEGIRKQLAIKALAGKEQAKDALLECLEDPGIENHFVNSSLFEIDSFREEREAEKEKSILQAINDGNYDLRLAELLESTGPELRARLHSSNTVTQKLTNFIIGSDFNWCSSTKIAEFLIGNSDATETLIDYLKNPEPPDEWQTIFAAIALRGERKATEVLIQTLNSTNPLAAQEAAESLIGIPEAIPTFKKALSRSKSQLARRAARALTGNLDATEELCATLQRSYESEEGTRATRLSAALALKGNNKAVETLIEVMKDPAQALEIRIGATQALEGSNQAEHELIDILATERRELRAAAAQSLRGKERAARLLLRNLKDMDPTLRFCCARSLQGIEAAVPELLLRLEKGQLRERVAAATALKGANAAIPALLNCLDTDSANLRKAALDSLKYQSDLENLLWQHFQPKD